MAATPATTAAPSAAGTGGGGMPRPARHTASKYLRVDVSMSVTSLPISRYSQYGNSRLAAIAIMQPTTVSIARSPMIRMLPGASRWNISSTYDDVNTTLAA